MRRVKVRRIVRAAAARRAGIEKANFMGNAAAKKDHVIGSFYNAAQAIGKRSGREAEQALKRLIPAVLPGRRPVALG